VSDTLEYLVTRDLQRQLESLEASVLKGNCGDWGNYQYLIGQICGIKYAMQAMLDAYKRAVKE